MVLNFCICYDNIFLDLGANSPSYAFLQVFFFFRSANSRQTIFKAGLLTRFRSIFL